MRIDNKLLIRVAKQLLYGKGGDSTPGELSTMKGALHRLKAVGISPLNVLDVGAAVGNWTMLAQTVWPESSYDLIEPLTEQKTKLEALQEKNAGKLRFHLGVAGETAGEVNFYVTDDLDGSGVYGEVQGKTRKVNVLTIDSICKGQQGSFLIKLDTHGYEVPILNGARETLKDTVALIIEVYGFQVSPTALLFHQLSAHLETIGFRLYDLVDVMRRNKDKAFWQADAVYLRKDHFVFKHNRYE